MQAQRAKREKLQPDPHIPGSVRRKRDAWSTWTECEVVCADKKPHEYLNAGVPESSFRFPAYSACPGCGKAVASLIGTVGVLCSECRWEGYMAHVTDLEEREQVQIAPRREDPASSRARFGFHDRPIRVAPIKWGESYA